MDFLSRCWTTCGFKNKHRRVGRACCCCRATLKYTPPPLLGRVSLPLRDVLPVFSQRVPWTSSPERTRQWAKTVSPSSSLGISHATNGP